MNPKPKKRKIKGKNRGWGKDLPLIVILAILVFSTVRTDWRVTQLSASFVRLGESVELLRVDIQAISEREPVFATAEGSTNLQGSDKEVEESTETAKSEKRYTGNPFTTQLWPGQLQCENITGMHWYTWYNGVQYNLTDTFLQVMYDMPLNQFYYRVFDNGLIYHYNESMVAINVHENQDGFCSMFGMGRPLYPNVTVEWYGLISTPGAGKDIFPGGLETWHGRADEGIACFRHNTTDYEVWSSFGGSATHTKLAGQDWTKRTKFKIEYYDDNAGDWDVKYYVDDVLEATHDGSAGDHTPEGVNMCVFFEVGHYAPTPNTETLVLYEWQTLNIAEGQP